jgi:RNA-directed DNA polymerase
MYEKLMEAVVADENYRLALGAVKRNRGAAGMDRMTTEQLEPHLQANWWILKDKLLKGTYVPSPVRRVEIPGWRANLKAHSTIETRAIILI